MHVPTARHPSRSSTDGFTLIELLVVVAVMSAVSLMAFGLSTEDRAQIRHDDTRLRLQSLRRAITGQLGPATPDTIGGFIADNGDLPSDLATLLQPGSLLAQGVQQPLFDPVPDTATCASNGGETPLSDNAALLVKGHRGDYLGSLTFNSHFRDGWGNEDGNSAADALNFGWAVVLKSADPNLTITSLGADNALGGEDFAADRSLNINAADWLVPLQGWNVRVTNYSGADIIGKKMAVSLLVFRNTASGGQWLRYSTPVADVCLDGTGDGLVSAALCPQSVTFAFSANCKAGDTASGASLVPQGRHLLLVTSDTDNTLWNSTDSPEWDTGKRSFARIDAVAGIALPEARLELR
ncbi:MAG: prepilin-type N-terminal cleavage/methylation domain-containing protein [Rhodoferax sp.]|nr:prepilin-type N-terminal cleavage/methylation domain-containing protein [Rhodoferax sp.]MDP3650409.1 prepilin-type N-terminal cleavage/methylation domain-containing protein [Rhodoferax sp.]